MEPKRYHHGDLKRTLLAVADKALTSTSADALSLRDVARRAGVSHTAPYKHFRDKSSLLRALVEYEFRTLRELTLDSAWRFPDQLSLQLRAVAEHWTQIALYHPRKMQLMTDLAKEFTPEQISAFEQLGLTQEKAQLFWVALLGTSLALSADSMGLFIESLLEAVEA